MVSRPQSPNQWYPAITDIASGSAASGRRTTNWSAASASRSTQPGAPAGCAARQRASTADSWATRRPHAAAPSSDGASSDESTTVTEAPGASAIRRVPDVQIVVDGVEPALGLAGEAIPQIPLVRRRSRGPFGEHGEWPGALVGRDAQPVRDGVDRHAPAAGMGARVEVAVVHHRLEGERGGRAAAQQRVAHVGRIGARLHPDALFDLGVGARERPHRRGAVEAEALDQPVAVRSERPVRPAIGVELPRRAPVLDRLVQLGDEERAAHGRLQRGHEQPVIAAGQESRDGARGESPDAVGAEPLPRLGRVEAAAGLTADVEERAVPADPLASADASLMAWLSRSTLRAFDALGGGRVRGAHAPGTSRTSVSPPSPMCRVRNASTSAR